MKSRMFKRLIISATFIIICMTMSGCKKSLSTWVKSSLPNELDERITVNTEQVNDLYELGLISSATRDGMLNTLQEQRDYLNKIREGGTNDSLLLNAVAAAKLYGKDYCEVGVWQDDNDNMHDISTVTNEETGETDTKSYDDLIDYLAGNYSYEHKKELSHYNGEPNWRVFTDENVTPYILISDKAANELQERLKFEVFVLNPSYEVGSSDCGIDSLCALIQAAIKPNTKEGGSQYTIDRRQMDRYFIPAVNENNEILHLIDFEDESNHLVRSTTMNYNYDNNGLGKDLVVQQNGYDQVSVRIQEFNPEFIDKLKQLFGNQSARMLVSIGDDGKDNRIYLLEYPISYVKSFVDNGDGTISPEFEESRIGINLFKGQLVKYNGKSDYNSAGTLIDGIENYYYTIGSEAPENETLSSFILKGRTDVDVSFSVDSEGEMSVNDSAMCGRIILRDYLELAYAPGCSPTSPEDNVVAFGRKLRLNFGSNWFETPYKAEGEVNSITARQLSQWDYKWDKRENIAYFVDASGRRMNTENKAVQSVTTLNATDICDSQAILGDDPVVKTLPEINNQSVQVKDGKTDLTGKAKIDELQHSTGTTIQAGIEFPGADVDRVDLDSDTPMKQWFYGMTVSTDLFETALYGGWINSTNEENSLEAWNSRMADTGMTYNVDHNEVTAYIEGNYAYELSQEGVVILDLDTVSKIQNDIDRDNKDRRNKFIQTTIIVLGWFLIGYSLVLMLAWALDINADIGVKFLEKLTLGHWVAVKDKSDIPYYDASERKYITMQDVIIKCAFIMIIGVLALTINIYNVVWLLIDMFAGLAEGIEKVIRGLS